MSIEVIAEAGVNHNGSLERALEMVDEAARAKADCVKFQTFVPEEVMSRYAGKADYQKTTTDPQESMLDMCRGLALGAKDFRELRDYCAKREIAFLSTPFDLPSVDLLVGELGCGRLKLPSGEITNLPLLLKAARTGCSLILSSGMCTLAEVERALGVLAFGFIEPTAKPSLPACIQAYGSPEGQAALNAKVLLLHCTAEYPTPFTDVNLRAMDTMAGAFGLPVGLSDHTSGIAVALAAAARGAVCLEKHFTLDKALPGPDHQASLEPADLRALVDGVRAIEKAMGDGVKRPAPSERKNIAVARKCLVARTTIRPGDTFTETNLAIKRAGGGVPAEEYWGWLGRTSARGYEEDEAIQS